MKRYNVFDLYVVTMHRINGLQSFICKRNGETYTEVLSNTKIEIRNNMIITPLSEYYEIYARPCGQ